MLSHPGADRSISLEGLKSFRMACRRYRNRRIGEYLKELGLTEGRNTGVHKMLKALRENGSPDPLFETDEERLWFMTTIYVRRDAGRERPRTARGREERRGTVMAYLAQNPASTIAAMQQSLGIPIATLNRDLAALKAAGLLERQGSHGDWIVRGH